MENPGHFSVEINTEAAKTAQDKVIALVRERCAALAAEGD